jgi:methionyl aminopeptidase
VRKSPGEIDAMAAAGALLGSTLERICAAAGPGVSTGELDRMAEESLRAAGGVPAFKGYPGGAGAQPFPGTICASVNEEVVHGIPGSRTLVEGDIIAIDIGVVLDGWVADTARTVAIGKVDEPSATLMDTTRAALDAGIAAARPGGRVGDIGHAVQELVEAAGLSVIRSLVGHGVGRSMHEEPQVPNYGLAGTGVPLEEGIVIAIEPMVNIGGPDVVLGEDGWTVTTRDGTRSAHFEHTVAITAEGPRILTLPS